MADRGLSAPARNRGKDPAAVVIDQVLDDVGAGRRALIKRSAVIALGAAIASLARSGSR